jgi:predicted NodU family carbamoyl transferase
MLVLGFSGIRHGAYYLEKYGLRFVGHDASVALVRDGEVLFAAEEERFSRHKHTSNFPVNAFHATLRDANMWRHIYRLLNARGSETLILSRDREGAFVKSYAEIRTSAYLFWESNTRKNLPSGSKNRSTTRSFSGMIALSVMVMFSGQTFVQHLVMLQ